MEEGVKEIVQKWVLKAENDLKTAAQILEAKEIITDTLCFHCQQTAEKFLKAFLVYHNTIPEKTHKIERLLEACCQIDSTFIELRDAILLSEYAVELRYIDDFFIPSIDEAHNAFRLAVKVKEFVLRRLP